MRLRAFVEPQMGATYDQQLAVATTAEECGFDAFFRSDHFITFGGHGRPGPTDSWVTLGAIARETRSIRLGTLVTSATFRWPGLLAIEVAQVDQMSGGRVELGLGTGWNEAEHTAYGVPFPPLGERFERLEESLQIVTGIWGTPDGERFSFDGRHYQLRDSPALPKPVQPRPPIIIGGGGARRTPRLAARYADEFNLPPFPHSPDAAAAAYRRVRDACERAGRDPATIVLSAAATTVVGADQTELERRVRRTGRQLDQLRQHAIAGTAAEVVDRLGAYADAGCEVFYTQLLDMDDLDHLRLIADEVMPALR